MKVHYETITKALDRVILAAEKQGRTIEFIELTPSEYHELLSHFPIEWPTVLLQQTTYNGVRVEQRP